MKAIIGVLALSLAWLPGTSYAELPALAKPRSFFLDGGNEFVEICAAVDVPCGIEIDSTAVAAAARQGSLKLSNLSGKAALKFALKRYPGYRTRLEKGALHIFPEKGIGVSPLDRKLRNVEFKNDGFSHVWEEFKKEGVEFDGWMVTAGGGMGSRKPRFMTFALVNTSVRDTLLSLVHEHGHAAWVVTRQVANGKATYSLVPYIY